MKLLFVSDVMLGRLVNRHLKGAPPEYPWGNALPLFRKGDLRICNLECVISDHGVPWSMTPKAFHFRTDAKNVEVLKRAGIGIVSLANNHTLDFEYEAMFEMLKFLDIEGIRHAGAGGNFKEASEPAICETAGVRIGFISFTDNVAEWAAAESVPGIYYVPLDIHDKRAQELFSRIQATKGKTDILILSAHWGPNWGYRPHPGHIPFAHLLIESGADIVFGHSCHVFQGIEIYKGRPILYSTGDFIDDYAVDEIERNDESFIFLVEFSGNELIRIRLYPTIIRSLQARLAEDLFARGIGARMQTLCRELGTRTEWNEEENCLEYRHPL